MELLNRYLQAVGFWLPRKQRKDIVAELSEDLRSQVEEREAELGRPLNEEETVPILKKCGNPMSVAGRYLPHPPEDPVWDMLYRFVVKAVLLCVIAPILVFVVVPGVFLAPDLPGALQAAVTSVLQGVIFAVGAITIGFAAARTLNKSAFARDDWDPRKLPSVVRLPDPQYISRGGSVLEIVMGLAVASWWIDIMPGFPMRWSLHQAGIEWTPTAVWEEFYGTCFWPVLAVMAAGMALSAVNLVRPYWTRRRVGFRALINGTAALLPLYPLLLHWDEVHGLYAKVTGPHFNATNAEVAVNALNLTIFLSLAVVSAVCLGSFLFEVIRFLMWKVAAEPTGGTR